MAKALRTMSVFFVFVVTLTSFLTINLMFEKNASEHCLHQAAHNIVVAANVFLLAMAAISIVAGVIMLCSNQQNYLPVYAVYLLAQFLLVLVLITLFILWLVSLSAANRKIDADLSHVPGCLARKNFCGSHFSEKTCCQEPGDCINEARLLKNPDCRKWDVNRKSFCYSCSSCLDTIRSSQREYGKVMKITILVNILVLVFTTVAQILELILRMPQN